MNLSPNKFEDDYLLSRQTFIEKFENYMYIDRHFVEGGLVVSLEGEFGSGKSTAIRMWVDDIGDRVEKDESAPFAILLNAWESDFGDDPLVPLVNALVTSIEGDQSFKNSELIQDLKQSVNDFCLFGSSIVNGVVAKTTGIDLLKAKNDVEQERSKRVVETPDFIRIFDNRYEALQNVKTSLKKYFSTSDQEIMIFVDELDRCRPDYAVRYLETIKHIFDIEEVIFVLAFDANQLSSTVKALFGGDTDFDEYLRKFIHRRNKLPEPSSDGIKNITKKYIELFLNTTSKRVSKIDFRHVELEICDLLYSTKMTPRQIQEVFRIIGYCTSKQVDSDESNVNNLRSAWSIAIVMIASFRVARPDLFESIQSGTMTVERFASVILDDLQIDAPEYWIDIFTSGLALRSRESLLAAFNVYFKNGFIRSGNSDDESVEILKKRLDEYDSPWGFTAAENNWKTVCDKIDSFEDFGN